MRPDLLDLTGGDEALLRELAAMFLEDAPARLAQLRAAVAAGDAGALHRVVHTIKGSAGNFGGKPLIVLAQNTEACARAGDLPGAAAGAADLEQMVEGLMAELRNL